MVLNAFPTLFGALVNLRELSINDALNFIKTAHNDFESLSALHFAIEYKSMSQARNNYPVFVGSIGLKNIDLINKKANLGYWIGEEYWGRGIATESVRLTINYAFYSSDLGLREIIAYVFPENKASIRVLEKNGMKKKRGEVNEYHELSRRYRNSLKYSIVLDTVSME